MCITAGFTAFSLLKVTVVDVVRGPSFLEFVVLPFDLYLLRSYLQTAHVNGLTAASVL